jgi:hypothetical protein
MNIDIRVFPSLSEISIILPSAGETISEPILLAGSLKKYKLKRPKKKNKIVKGIKLTAQNNNASRIGEKMMYRDFLAIISC